MKRLKRQGCRHKTPSILKPQSSPVTHITDWVAPFPVVIIEHSPQILLPFACTRIRDNHQFKISQQQAYVESGKLEFTKHPYTEINERITSKIKTLSFNKNRFEKIDEKEPCHN